MAMPAKFSQPICTTCQWFNGIHSVCFEPRRQRIRQSYDMGGTSILTMAPVLTDASATCDFHAKHKDANYREE